MVIELGAGTGLCGLYLSACGTGRVIITDLSEAVGIMVKNISLNVLDSADSKIDEVLDNNGFVKPDDVLDSTDGVKSDAHTNKIVEARELKWGCRQDVENVFASFSYDMSSPPLIIASDCVYWACLYKPFFETLCICVEEYNCTVLISHVKRWKKDEKFFAMCRKKMSVEIVKEDVSYEKEENSLSGKERRQVSRIYKISKKAAI